MNQREVVKQLRTIAENTKPADVGTARAVTLDPEEPQKAFTLQEYNCSGFTGSLATHGKELRPPRGMYYRVISFCYFLETGGASANQQLAIYVESDQDAAAAGSFGIGARCSFHWVSPVIAASHTVEVQIGDYVFYESSEGADYYFIPFPRELLLTNDRPLRFAAVPVANDFIWIKVIYEVVRT